MKPREVNFWYFVVRLLPKKLIYFCTAWLIGQVTTGKYSRTEVLRITALEALRRYGDDNGI